MTKCNRRVREKQRKSEKKNEEKASGVYNYDWNGKLIEELSKVEVPMPLIKKIFEIFNRHLEWDESRVIRTNGKKKSK